MTALKEKFKAAMRDMALEAGYDADDVDLAVRALDRGKLDQDDISEAYFRVAGFIGWTYIKDEKVTPPGPYLLRACRYLETEMVSARASAGTGRRLLEPAWPGVRAFGTESPW